MSEDRGASAATRVSAGTNRVLRAWRATPHEHRLAAYASVGLFLTLFLPWYQVTVIDTTKATKLQSLTESLTGWGAFSFVEAAVLLVAAGVLTLLFQRAEGHAFHLPGGDGGVITAAGVWTCLLIMWRIFDKQGTSGHGQYATTSGIEWGIFVALAVAAFLAYAGSRIRAAHRPEPPLPGEADPIDRSGTAPTEAVRAPAPAPAAAPGPVRSPRPVRPPRPVRADQPRTDQPTRRRSRKRWNPDREAAPTWDDGSEEVTVRKPRSAPPPRSDDPSEVTTRRDRKRD